MFTLHNSWHRWQDTVMMIRDDHIPIKMHVFVFKKTCPNVNEHVPHLFRCVIKDNKFLGMASPVIWTCRWWGWFGIFWKRTRLVKLADEDWDFLSDRDFVLEDNACVCTFIILLEIKIHCWAECCCLTWKWSPPRRFWSGTTRSVFPAQRVFNAKFAPKSQNSLMSVLKIEFSRFDRVTRRH